MMRLLITAVIVFGVTTPSHADFKNALDAYKRGDHKIAYQNFLPLAKKGDARSRLMLGVMHGEGKGMKRDDFMAHVWFILASKSARRGRLHKLAEKYRRVFAEDLTVPEMIEAGRVSRQWSMKWRREFYGAWRKKIGRPGL